MQTEPDQEAWDTPEYAVALDDSVEFITEARRLVVLTGAGASTESGIPDFRSPNGIWSRTTAMSYHAFMQSSAARREYWRVRRELYPLIAQARPNVAHRALVELERRGTLLAIITQNFDGLHQMAGSSPDRVIELHGTSREAACQTCGARLSMDEIQARVDAGDDDPRCTCGGYLKAATVLFGQQLPQPALKAALEFAGSCDLFLVIGSSLRVMPAARLPRVAYERGIPLLIVNIESTPLDEHADVVLRAPAGPTLTRIVAGIAALDR